MLIAPAVDRDFILDLGRRSLPPTHTPLAYEILVSSVLARDHLALVATDWDPVGFVLAIFDLPNDLTLSPQAFVAYIAVEPAYQRRGVARALLEAVEAEARGRGLPYLSLMVTNDNHHARHLYESAGFATERRQMTKAL